MTQDHWNQLRDQLFASRFTVGYKERIFRFLAVLPGGDNGGAATVHYAYAPGVWTRAGETRDADSVLRGLIAGTPFAEVRLDLKFHHHLRNGWPLPWNLTAKASSDDFPTLVVIERPDGSVTGALMRDPHTGATVETLADAAEPEEAAEVIALLRELPLDAKHLTWYKDSNIDAPSLAAAIAQTPETEQRQKALLVYRDCEWFQGLWNNPEKGQTWAGESLQSVADFHGTRVSAAKRATRAGLDIVRRSQTLPGDAQVLRQALRELPLHETPHHLDDLEAWPAVRTVCAWWNSHAPENMRSAGLFRTYIWSETDLVFIPGDPEEPVVQASQLAKEGVFALFEAEGRPVVAIQFYRGRAFNTESSFGGTQTYLANGDEALDIGLDVDEVNEAYYSVLGLRSVLSHWH